MRGQRGGWGEGASFIARGARSEIPITSRTSFERRYFPASIHKRGRAEDEEGGRRGAGEGVKRALHTGGSRDR